MPTKTGDVVIVGAAGKMFSVWTVSRDGQQTAAEEPRARATSALGLDGATKLAFLMARLTRGSVFFLDRDAGTWTEVTR